MSTLPHTVLWLNIYYDIPLKAVFTGCCDYKACFLQQQFPKMILFSSFPSTFVDLCCRTRLTKSLLCSPRLLTLTFKPIFTFQTSFCPGTSESNQCTHHCSLALMSFSTCVKRNQYTVCNMSPCVSGLL